MKYNYRMELQYDGTRYNGWQRQGNTECTIQGLIEEILSEYLEEKIEVKASGRTDRGVHAISQVANFYSSRLIKVEPAKTWLNERLPEDIRIFYMEKVALSFHSRKSAVRKTYEYCIWNSTRKNVFYNRYAFTVESPLDIAKMKEGAEYLCGTHDFLGFSSLKESKKNTIRTIEKIQIDNNGEMIVIRFTGNGFLYHMVRILTGTLLEVGLEIRTPDSVLDIFQHKKRELAGYTVPAQGLKLVSVEYE